MFWSTSLKLFLFAFFKPLSKAAAGKMWTLDSNDIMDRFPWQRGRVSVRSAVPVVR